MEKTIPLLLNSIENDDFITAIWSNPRHATDCSKLTLKPIEIKSKKMIQCAMQKEQKEYHENLEIDQLQDFIMNTCMGFKQLQIFTGEKDYAVLINKKGMATVKAKPPTKKLPENLSHNRQKHYILDNQASIPFLMALGIMGQDGEIKPSKYDKYRQINRYLEMIEDVMPHLQDDTIRIIDFGCGKSYLTFAMYHYFYTLKQKAVEIIGLDLKKDVIEFCNKLAQTLGYTQLKFQVGDIGQYTTNQKIDMVVSLHACNTATDAAIAKAIGWEAKAILAVPCCHHEAYTQIENELMAPILKHGILKERIAALLTDGLRAQMLECMGYKVNVIEFIDMTHTPKNILIRAIRKGPVTLDPQQMTEYDAFCKAFHLDLTLPHMLDNK
ncbi:MAG: SAM-dependent methyltransferase [Cellulosilyticaceae bacterium]